MMDSEDEIEYDTDSYLYSECSEDDFGYATDSSHQDKKIYTILSEADIQRRQAEGIERICTFLPVSRDSAIMLLKYFKWHVDNVEIQWFANEEKVCKAIGLLRNPVFESRKEGEVKCDICLENFPRAEMDAAVCGHPYCLTCWKGYMRTSIRDGPGCLVLRCPDPSCNAAIGQGMVNKLACEEDKERYSHYLVRSYVEGNPRAKWCPAPGCNYAVEFDLGSDEQYGYDVKCLCSYKFCWNCTEEAHTPVDCDTVSKWILKNADESENTHWILANSKPCPKCKRPIEKNHGCMHMTCSSPCRFQFCWLCLGPWSEHGEKTGGFYSCNRYKSEGESGEVEKIRNNAKKYIERYTHYYERWAANHSSRQKALVDLQKVQTAEIKKLREKLTRELESGFNFITDAWLQIVECRRVLKWTYAYGYYLSEHEGPKKVLFEYLQGDAEAGLERLHECAEKELREHLGAEGPSEGFGQFREKLARLTGVTRIYFENLVHALANGLSDVTSGGASSKIDSC